MLWQIISIIIFVLVLVLIITQISVEKNIRNKCGGGIKIDVNETRGIYNISV